MYAGACATLLCTVSFVPMGVIVWPGNVEVVAWYVVGAGVTVWRMQVAMHVDGDYCYVCLAQGCRPGEPGLEAGHRPWDALGCHGFLGGAERGRCGVPCTGWLSLLRGLCRSFL